MAHEDPVGVLASPSVGAETGHKKRVCPGRMVGLLDGFMFVLWRLFSFEVSFLRGTVHFFRALFAGSGSSKETRSPGSSYVLATCEKRNLYTHDFLVQPEDSWLNSQLIYTEFRQSMASGK